MPFQVSEAVQLAKAKEVLQGIMTSPRYIDKTWDEASLCAMLANDHGGLGWTDAQVKNLYRVLLQENWFEAT